MRRLEPRPCLIFTIVALLLLPLSTPARSQAFPALWEIDHTGSSSAAIHTIAARNESLVDDLRTIDPVEFGCIVAGSITGIAIFADPRFIAPLIGETVVALGPAALYGALGGALVASVCLIVDLTVPPLVDLYHRHISPPDRFTTAYRRSEL